MYNNSQYFETNYNKMKLCFLTFCNNNYMSTNRILNEAKSFNMFDVIVSKSEDDIPEFIEKHKEFIEKEPYGFGRWIWKPKIIFDSLNSLNDNDILVYADAGCYLNKNGIERFKYYLTSIEKEKDICVFSTNDYYKAQHYVKRDCIMNYYPEFSNELSNCCYAGLMIIRKTCNTLKLIEDWLNLCENHHFLDNSPSYNYSELPCYIGQDCDNGIFNLCLSKFKDIVFKVYPDEVNLYNGNKQIDHNKYKNIDWSSLDNIPFQCRRLTPKFGH
jgi:hypothetical protein